MTIAVRSRFAFWIAGLYLALGLAAWTLPWIAKPGESLAGVYVVMLAFPWSTVLLWLMDGFGIDSMIFSSFFLLLGLVFNAAILYYGIAWLTGKIF
jgi:hypothetical protein